jgi:hypothetical protein
MNDRRNTPHVPADSAPFRPIPPVPPGSTALREFCHAVARTLTIPDPALRPGLSSVQLSDEIACLRLYRDRARLVVSGMRRILADFEIDDRDIMTFVVSLREEVSYRADRDHNAGGPS